ARAIHACIYDQAAPASFKRKCASRAADPSDYLAGAAALRALLVADLARAATPLADGFARAGGSRRRFITRAHRWRGGLHLACARFGGGFHWLLPRSARERGNTRSRFGGLARQLIGAARQLLFRPPVRRTKKPVIFIAHDAIAGACR